MSAKFSFPLLALLLVLPSFSARLALGQAAPSAPRRVKVSDVAASSLLAEKMSPKYPDAARNAGIQGSVVPNWWWLKRVK